MSKAASATVPQELDEMTITDVWSRTASKYRVRAVVLLIVNILLFAGLGCFAYWLRTGTFFAPAEDGYWGLFARTFLPGGEATLSNFVLFPIRLDVVPLHGVVVGLLLAALVSIPILISILYRFPCCIPFILVVSFLAVMPWLAINLTGACILASVKPFRLRFRYASALLGLVLVLLYFYGASRQTTPLVEHYKPVDRIKFMAPWVLATIASCVIMGGVLLLAKLVNNRPGVVAPLLLVSFAVPVALFEKYVGRDELHYRLLEKRIVGKFLVGEHHVDHDVSDWFERIAYQKWESRPEPKPSFETVRELADFRMTLELDAETNMPTAFAQERDQLIRECDQLIRSFPDSRYAVNMLYLKGRMLDLRIDLSVFRDQKLIRYYDDFPSPNSEFVWRQVLANAPDSSVAAVGRYKLAVFAARRGQLGKAIEWLDELITKFDPARPAPEPAEPKGMVQHVLASAPADASLKIPVPQTVFEAKQFQALVLENGSDARYGARPFCGSRPGEPPQPGLLQLDPRHQRYEDNLHSIVVAYPKCLLADNLALIVAMCADDRDERIARLQYCLADYPQGDARAETLFRLGVAYSEAGLTGRTVENLETVVRDHPQSLWAPLAEERLRTLRKEATP